MVGPIIVTYKAPQSPNGWTHFEGYRLGLNQGFKILWGFKGAKPLILLSPLLYNGQSLCKVLW